LAAEGLPRDRGEREVRHQLPLALIRVWGQHTAMSARRRSCQRSYQTQPQAGVAAHLQRRLDDEHQSTGRSSWSHDPRRPDRRGQRVLVVAFSASQEGHAASDQRHTHALVASATTSHNKAAFHDAMRKLWEDHITWDAPGDHQLRARAPRLACDAGPAAAQQTDIGNAIKPYYGRAAGNRLTTVLRSTSPARSPCFRPRRRAIRT
jgi:hypothetical protein